MASKGKYGKYELRYLSIEEWDKLNSIKKSPRDALIFSLLYNTGCTVNELVNIKVDDVDFKRNTITIRSENSRNREERFVFAGLSLILKIKEFTKKSASPYILFTRQSERMTKKRVQQLVLEYCSRIQIENAGPQVIRYTHIVHAYHKNIPVDAIIKQVGLKRSRAIEIFSQLKEKTTENAYEAFTK